MSEKCDFFFSYTSFTSEVVTLLFMSYSVFLKPCSYCKQICNAVVVARLLNATLIVPKFMYSSVWRDVR